MAEKKLVRATMKETLMSDLGRLERGRAYEIPEDRLAVWEKAGLVEKGGEESKGEESSKESAEPKKEKKLAKGGKE